jgi:hypothetical protein
MKFFTSLVVPPGLVRASAWLTLLFVQVVWSQPDQQIFHNQFAVLVPKGAETADQGSIL